MTSTALAMLFIDLDGFKQINDQLGHQVGDQVLIEASRRLRDGLRSGETVGRLGGDEFVVLVEAIVHPGIPIEIADRLLRSLQSTDRRPRVESTGSRRASGSRCGHRRCDDVEELMLSADQAMYTAKRSGRGRWALAHQEFEATSDAVL